MIMCNKEGEHLRDLRVDGDNIKVDLKYVVIVFWIMWLRIRISGRHF
jgi:hypothetical protein